MLLQRKETSLELPETMNIKNLVNSERSSPQSLPLWLTLYGNKSVSFTKLDFYCCHYFMYQILYYSSGKQTYNVTCVISSDLPCKDVNARFTTIIPLKPLFDQVEDIVVFQVENCYLLTIPVFLPALELPKLLLSRTQNNQLS